MSWINDFIKFQAGHGLGALSTQGQSSDDLCSKFFHFIWGKNWFSKWFYKKIQKQIKAIEKEKLISEDDQKRYEKDIQDLTDKYTKEIESFLKKKQEELLKV